MWSGYCDEDDDYWDDDYWDDEEEEDSLGVCVGKAVVSIAAALILRAISSR